MDPSSSPAVQMFENLSCANGYNEGNFTIEDIREVTTKDCTLNCHPPLWGQKVLKPVPYAEVQANMKSMCRWSRQHRTADMELALHPNGTDLALFHTVKIMLKPMPCCYLMQVPIVWVAKGEVEDGKLKVKEVHEHAAKTPAEALEVIQKEFDFPADTTFSKFLREYK